MGIYARQNPQSYNASRALAQSSLDATGNRKVLSVDEFNQTFGAAAEDMAKITAWAKTKKLKVLDASAKQRILVEGTIADVDAAFGVELNEYDHPESGRYRGREAEIHVPAELSGIVEGVFGLDNRRVGRLRNRRSRALSAAWQDSRRPRAEAVQMGATNLAR